MVMLLAVAAALVVMMVLVVMAAAFVVMMVLVVMAAAFVVMVVLMVMAAAFVVMMVLVVTAAAFVVMVVLMAVAAAFMVMVMLLLLVLLGKALGLHLGQLICQGLFVLHRLHQLCAGELIPGVVTMVATALCSRRRATAPSSFSWLMESVRLRTMVDAVSIWSL